MRPTVEGTQHGIGASPGFAAWLVVGHVSYTLILALSVFCYSAESCWGWSRLECVTLEALQLCLVILLAMAMNFAVTTWAITMWRSTQQRAKLPTVS